MKPWIVLTALTALLVLAGVWLVLSQSPDVEVPVKPEEEGAVVESMPALAATPNPAVRTAPPEPERAPDQTEILRALEEVAKNQQALEDWDKQLAQACKNLVKGRKYEEAQQCYQLRLARNPEDAEAYMERGILHARMGKRVESYWDYQKYLELAPDGPKAPQIRSIVEAYDAWASGTKPPERTKFEYREEIVKLARRLYEEAYVIKSSNPEEALRKLQIVMKMVEKYDQTYRDKAERLIERIESASE